MSESLLIGIGLTMIAGLMSGNCMLPMKFVHSWKWEHIWLVFSVVSLLVIPWALAFGLVGNLFATYQALSLGQLAIPFSFGVGWGVAQVLFGISVARLGLALAYAIIVGLSALLGTLVPLFVQRREGTAGHTLALVLTGVTVMVAGICLASWAGQLREDEKSANFRAAASRLPGCTDARDSLRPCCADVELFVRLWTRHREGSHSLGDSAGLCRLRGMADWTRRRTHPQRCLQPISALQLESRYRL